MRRGEGARVQATGGRYDKPAITGSAAIISAATVSSRAESLEMETRAEDAGCEVPQAERWRFKSMKLR